MGLRTILLICWLMPLVLLLPILYQEYGPHPPEVVETNTNMRVRMCREHIDAAKVNPEDAGTRTAIDECVTAGYVSKDEVRTTLD